MDISEVMNLFDTYYPLLIVLVTGVTQATKMMLPDTWATKGAPCISIILGIMFCFILMGVPAWQKATLVGTLIGLASSGLFSGAAHFMDSLKKTQAPAAPGQK